MGNRQRRRAAPALLAPQRRRLHCCVKQRIERAAKRHWGLATWAQNGGPRASGGRPLAIRQGRQPMGPPAQGHLPSPLAQWPRQPSRSAHFPTPQAPRPSARSGGYGPLSRRCLSRSGTRPAGAADGHITRNATLWPRPWFPRAQSQGTDGVPLPWSPQENSGIYGWPGWPGNWAAGARDGSRNRASACTPASLPAAGGRPGRGAADARLLHDQPPSIGSRPGHRSRALRGCGLWAILWVALYNPRSARRGPRLAAGQGPGAAGRGDATTAIPVVLGANWAGRRSRSPAPARRPPQRTRSNMLSLVLVGNSSHPGCRTARIVTPRGYPGAELGQA